MERELGDLIYIFSIIYNNRKFFEKLSFSQFKRGNNLDEWDLRNKGQLYLLTRFPAFKGAGQSSIIPPNENSLPNYSGSLGTYGLLYKPGDYIHINAQLLDTILSDRNSLKRVELSLLLRDYPSYFRVYDSLEFEKVFHFYVNLDRHYLGGFSPFCNSSFSTNVYDFIQKYLRGCIGEIIYGVNIHYNSQALILINNIFKSLQKRAKSRKDTSLTSFVDDFFKTPYANDVTKGFESTDYGGDGGGIGIIYTKVILGESNHSPI
ncbi:MAG: hypothetical protein QXO75_11025 [Nitrososphaerota archaeon]